MCGYHGRRMRQMLYHPAFLMCPLQHDQTIAHVLSYGHRLVPTRGVEKCAFLRTETWLHCSWKLHELGRSCTPEKSWLTHTLSPRTEGSTICEAVLLCKSNQQVPARTQHSSADGISELPPHEGPQPTPEHARLLSRLQDCPF